MIMYRGMGAVCSDGSQPDSLGNCATGPDVITQDLDAAFSAIPNPFASTAPGTGGNASTNISVVIPSGLTLNAQGQVVQGQTFSQWIEANQTVIVVACAVLGGIVALTRIGKR